MTSLKVKFAPAPAPTKLVNVVLFDISWLAIVALHSSLLAPLVVLAHLGVHWAYVSRNRAEYELIAAISVFGIVLDHVLFRTGVFLIDGDPGTPPVWMSCLWPVLATTLLHALQSLRRHTVVLALLGAVGGVLSYRAGAQLTDVTFASIGWGSLLIGVLWAVLFPLLVNVAPWYQQKRG